MKTMSIICQIIPATATIITSNHFHNTFATSTHRVWDKVTNNVFQLWKNKEQKFYWQV